MSDDHQIEIPPSFIALFVEPGRIKPSASRLEILERYEYCEDIANALIDSAQTHLWQLGIAEEDVLERMHAGLMSAEAGVSPAEARWITRRLAELLGWDGSAYNVSA